MSMKDNLLENDKGYNLTMKNEPKPKNSAFEDQMQISDRLFNFLVKNAFICQLSHVNQPPNLIGHKMRGKCTDYTIADEQNLLEIEYSKIKMKIVKISQDFLKEVPDFYEKLHLSPSVRKSTKKNLIVRNTARNMTLLSGFHF